jgi:hypothetical protein
MFGVDRRNRHGLMAVISNGWKFQHGFGVGLQAKVGTEVSAQGFAVLGEHCVPDPCSPTMDGDLPPVEVGQAG